MSVLSRNSVLTLRQQRALRAVLEHPTLTAAAQAAGISERTLRRWLQQDAFQDACRELLDITQRDAIAQTTTHLKQVSTEAVRALRQVMSDGLSPAGCRVAAARTILEMAYRATILEQLRLLAPSATPPQLDQPPTGDNRS